MSIKISQLPAASSVQDTAIFPLVQDSTTEKATIAQLAAAIGGNVDLSNYLQLVPTPSADQTVFIPSVNNLIFGNNSSGGTVQFNVENVDMNLGSGGLNVDSGSVDMNLLNSLDINVENANSSLDINMNSSGSSFDINVNGPFTVDSESITLQATGGNLYLESGSGNIIISAGGKVYLPNYPSYSSLGTDSSGAIIAGSGGGGGTIIVEDFTSTIGGPFIVAHTLGNVPKAVTFTMTNSSGSLGQFWLDTSNVALGYDSANVYGIASDANIAGQIIVFG